MATLLDNTPATDKDALIRGAIGGVSAALPAAAVLTLAKAYRQERRRMDLAKAKDSDTLVITLPEKRGQVATTVAPAASIGDYARKGLEAVGDKAKAIAEKYKPGAADAKPSASPDTTPSTPRLFSVDTLGRAAGDAVRLGVDFTKRVGAAAGKGLSEAMAPRIRASLADLQASSRQALKYLAFVIAGGATLRGADALYEAYNQRKLRRLEDASRKEYINRLFAKDAQALPVASQRGDIVGGVMALMALIAGTSAYGTKRVLDVMYPKSYNKVKAPAVRRIEFRSLPHDAQKSDDAEEYEEFRDAAPNLKAAAVYADGSERSLPWDVVRALGFRYALVKDASENAFRKFSNHEDVIEWCSERGITTAQLREKLAQEAQMANEQQQAAFYRMVDDVLKNPELLGKVNEISQRAVNKGREATSFSGRLSRGYFAGPAIAAETTSKRVLDQMRQEMASGIADKFGLAMPRFSTGAVDGELAANIMSEVKRQEPALRSMAYKTLASNPNVSAMLAKNVQATTAYKTMSPTLKKVMDWLGSREPGSLPRMLYDWIIKRQVASALTGAEEQQLTARANAFANAPGSDIAAAAAKDSPPPASAGVPAADVPVAPPVQPTAQPPAVHGATYGMPGGLGGVPSAFAAAAPAATPPAAGDAGASGKATASPAPSATKTAPAATHEAPAPAATSANSQPAQGNAGRLPGAPVAPSMLAHAGVKNVANGAPFVNGVDLPTSKYASSGFSPSALAEKLLATRKSNTDDEDAGEQADTSKQTAANRRHIDVEATDPRAEAFIRKNKSRLVAALSNAVNSGDL